MVKKFLSRIIYLTFNKRLHNAKPATLLFMVTKITYCKFNCEVQHCYAKIETYICFIPHVQTELNNCII